MDEQRPFVKYADYEIALLRLLATLPGGQGSTAEVCRLFGAEYKHRIPSRDLETVHGSEPKWLNIVRWGRNSLIKHGLVDAPDRGVWRITAAGRRWVEENPGPIKLEPGTERRRDKAIKTSFPLPPTKPKDPRLADITLEKLERIRELMPPDEFRREWGPLYDLLLAKEQGKAVTEITPSEIGRRARQRLDDIHALLRGSNTTLPSGEIVCDWIHFCYALDLLREAAALLQYVRDTDVDPAIYRRAKRVAEACRSKLTG